MRWTALLIVAAMMVGGCEGGVFKGGPGQGGSPEQPWMFAPAVMRVHPFTSFVSDKASGATVLEVRIELVDRVGDVTKGVGDFRFELYEVREHASREGEEVRAYVWDAPMATLEQNQQHYDPITRTYTFRLKLAAAPDAEQKYKLLAQFTDRQGRRLTASAPLRYKPAASEPAGGQTSSK